MSSEVKRYIVSKGELLSFDTLQAANVDRLVDYDDYAALEAENAWLLAANLDCVAHFEQMRAELAAIKGQEAVAYVHPLYLKPGALGFEASVCRLAPAQVPLYALPPATPDVWALVEALRESVEYLDSNQFNEIGAGSVLHRQMRDALSAHAQQKGGIRHDA